MNDKKAIVGSFEWADLTVDNTDDIRDFYSDVIGFSFSEVPMGDYNDYCMNSPTDEQTKVGICHARGQNSGIPPVWMIYFIVEDLNASIIAVEQGGGQIISDIKGNDKNGMYCFIKDPSGAACALFQKGT
jgi:predicted enzyme related to lactoylglutathione lyase